MKHFIYLIIFCVFVFAQISCSQNQNVSKSKIENVANVKQSNLNSVESIKEKNDIDYFAHFEPKHKEVMKEWLKKKPFLRPATEQIDSYVYQIKDKENFEGNLKSIREYIGEKGTQYYSIGDFNQDGKDDFAVILFDSRSKEDDIKTALAIYNAPFKKGQSPAYFEENLDRVSNLYITYDKMSPKHLYLGVFESDVYCATYYPKGNTYTFKDCM
ncbi:MAG: hypothetical protein ACR2J3_02450 [Aridibacter sp.]